MIDVRQAVAIAIQYFVDLYPDLFGEGKPVDSLLLEEVELSEDGKYWLITLGFTQAIAQPPHPNNPIATLMPKITHQRIYKVFKIKTDDGTVVSMKIREIPQYSVV